MRMTNQRNARRLFGGGVLAGLAVATVLTAVGVGGVSAAASQGENITISSNGNLITAGGSATTFSLVLPTGAACSSDTASGGYQVQTYMVPASVDPSTITYGAGATPAVTTGASFREPLFSSTGSAVTNRNTGVGSGVISGLPLFSFGVYTSTDIPDGVYNLGVACTKGTAGPTQLDKFWNVKLNFGADPADPAGFSWDIAAPGVPTSLSQAAATTTSVDVHYAAPAYVGVSAVTNYVYRYGTSATGPWTTVSTASATPGTVQISGLATRTKYWVQVQAANATDSGAWATVNATTLPSAPGTPTPTPGNGSVSLSWAAPATDGGASVTYKVEYTSTDGASWATAAPSVSATTYNVTGLTNGVAYKFRVTAATAGGAGAPSATSAAATPVGAPGAPTGLAVTAATTTSLDLSWTAPADNGGSAITDYTVQYSLTGGAPWTTVTHPASSGTGLSVTGLSPRTVYTFQVAAVNAPAGAGAFSATTTGTTTPGAPGTPVIGALGNGSIGVSWSAPAGTAAVTYNLDISSNGGVSFTPKATGLATTSTTVTGLVNGTSYRFRVSAVDAGGTSAVSATSAAGVPRTVASAPGKPVLTPSNKSVKLTWTAPASTGGAAITSYVVQRSTNGTTWVTLTTTAPLTRTYTATGLTNGVKYYFRVAAKNPAGVGAYSLANTAIPRTVPTAPGKPIATALVKAVKLTWAAPASNGGSAVTGYVVQKSLDGVHWTTVTTAAPLTRTYTVPALLTGKSYRFRVAAKNVAGVGPYSAVTAATPR